MLAWGEEEGAVDQGIPGEASITSNSQFGFQGETKRRITSPLKDVHHAVAENARDSIHLVGGVVGEDEAAGLVVADAALVLHLDVVRVDLGPGQHIEGAVVRASEEDASPTVMSAIGDSWVRICYMKMKMIQI